MGQDPVIDQKQPRQQEPQKQPQKEPQQEPLSEQEKQRVLSRLRELAKRPYLGKQDDELLGMLGDDDFFKRSNATAELGFRPWTIEKLAPLTHSFDIEERKNARWALGVAARGLLFPPKEEQRPPSFEAIGYGKAERDQLLSKLSTLMSRRSKVEEILKLVSEIRDVRQFAVAVSGIDARLVKLGVPAENWNDYIVRPFRPGFPIPRFNEGWELRDRWVEARKAGNKQAEVKVEELLKAIEVVSSDSMLKELREAMPAKPDADKGPKKPLDELAELAETWAKMRKMPLFETERRESTPQEKFARRMLRADSFLSAKLDKPQLVGLFAEVQKQANAEFTAAVTAGDAKKIRAAIVRGNRYGQFLSQSSEFIGGGFDLSGKSTVKSLFVYGKAAVEAGDRKRYELSLRTLSRTLGFSLVGEDKPPRPDYEIKAQEILRETISKAKQADDQETAGELQKLLPASEK